MNNECVNHNVAIMTKETNKTYHKKYREEHTEQLKLNRKKYYEENGMKEKFKCPICFRYTNKLKLKRHQTSNFCRKAQEKSN